MTDEMKRLEDSHRCLCTRVAMLEMVIKDLMEELTNFIPDDRMIRNLQGLLPCNNDHGRNG